MLPALAGYLNIFAFRPHQAPSYSHHTSHLTIFGLYSIVRRSVCVLLFCFFYTRHIATGVSGFLSVILHAGTEPLACFSRIVLAGTTPFAVHAGTEPHACVSASRVLSHNDGSSALLVLREREGLRLKPYTGLPPLLNS